MNFIIHIGTHKTGSTALQQFLFLNKKTLLEKHGILYPSSGLTRHAHHEVVTAARQGGSEGLEAVLQEIESEASDAGVDKVILSSEGFEFLRDDALLAPLKARSVSVVAFLRRPDTYLESEYNQHVKMYQVSFTEDIYKFYLRHNFSQRFNYRGLCRFWGEFSNGSPLRAINYDDCAVDRLAIYKEFLVSCGIDWNGDFTIPGADKNVSLPNAATIYMARLNALGLSKAQHKKATILLADEFAEMKNAVLLSEEDRKVLWKQNKATNQFVAKKYGMKPFKMPDQIELSEKPVVDFYRDFDPSRYDLLMKKLGIDPAAAAAD